MGNKSKFFWHDLMTSDVEKAKAFYGELFGWSFKGDKNDKSPNPYTHIMAGETGIGGMMKLDPSHGAPPHWMGYVSVPDIKATVDAVTKHGGKIYMPITDIPEVGPFAVVADPHGAVFSPMQYTGKDADKPETDAMPGLNNFCWDELATSDPAAATKFYGDVFGWGSQSMEMPGFGTYTLLNRPGTKDAKGMPRQVGGVMKLPQGATHPYWLSYVAVGDCDATVERAKRLGGKVLAPATDIPDVGRFAALLDSQHAAFAILAPKMPA